MLAVTLDFDFAVFDAREIHQVTDATVHEWYREFMLILPESRSSLHPAIV